MHQTVVLRPCNVCGKLVYKSKFLPNISRVKEYFLGARMKQFFKTHTFSKAFAYNYKRHDIITSDIRGK